VNPTGYLLKTATQCGNPRKSVIEGSNDGEDWAKLSEGRNNRDAAVSQRFSTPGSGSVGMIRLCQTGKNHTGGHEPGILFFDTFGLTAYEVAATVPPKPLDLESIQALIPPLGTDEFADVIPRFSDLAALQVIELVRRFLMAPSATQAFEMTRMLFPLQLSTYGGWREGYFNDDCGHDFSIQELWSTNRSGCGKFVSPGKFVHHSPDAI
jgi:hypothetical protein